MYRLFVIILTILCFSSCDIFSGNSQKEKELFNKIQKGMTIADVKEVLGEPDAITPSSSRDNSYYYYYFTKNKSGMRSEMPYVLFDSTGLVKFSTYGDGG